MLQVWRVERVPASGRVPSLVREWLLPPVLLLVRVLPQRPVLRWARVKLWVPVLRWARL